MNLESIEKQIYDEILGELVKKPDPGMCDIVFGNYSRYVLQCETAHLASRAAWFSRERLIPAVLSLEGELSTPFHKGALFHDTGVAHLLAGNEDGYEYFLAMTDEQEVRKTGGAHERGTANLLSGPLAEHTITKRMEFACSLLNGKIAGCAADFSFMTGLTPISPAQIDAWRKSLDNLHQFELLRIIYDVEVFLGNDYPKYPPCADNPFVMLRLAKALSHLAQFVESRLTSWQPVKRKGLHEKLQKDEDFGKSLVTAAGGEKCFPGKSPLDATIIDGELHQLLTDLAAAPVGVERQWRLLRIFYIVRNSTAHTIEPDLGMYNDRGFVLNLLQVVFVSLFTICQLKKKPVV